MPLMACPKCGQSVSSLASVCPNCSFSLREQRLKEGRLGPRIRCRKCGQNISATADVCPHCGVDYPKRTFNLLLVAAPIGAVVLAFGIFLLLSGGSDPGSSASAPPPLSDGPPAVTPPETATPAEATEEQAEPESDVRAAPILVESPPGSDQDIDAPTSERTRWTADWVNVREGPSPDAPVAQILDPGVRVEAGGYDGGFWEVYIDGRLLGYVANSLLLQEPPEP